MYHMLHNILTWTVNAARVGTLPVCSWTVSLLMSGSHWIVSLSSVMPFTSPLSSLLPSDVQVDPIYGRVSISVSDVFNASTDHHHHTVIANAPLALPLLTQHNFCCHNTQHASIAIPSTQHSFWLAKLFVTMMPGLRQFSSSLCLHVPTDTIWQGYSQIQF